MSQFKLIALSSLLLAALLCAQQANAGVKNTSTNGDFSFKLESNGQTLPVYNYKGYSYAQGYLGETYAIRVINHINERIEVVVTVDGRDVVSGKEGNYRNARGYVIKPYDSVLIKGFRTSINGVASFYFTDIEDSYAARMGNDVNVGVVGVAVFKEKRIFKKILKKKKPKQIATGKKYHKNKLKQNRKQNRKLTKSNQATGYVSTRARTSSYLDDSGASLEIESPNAVLDNCVGCDQQNIQQKKQNIGTGYGDNQYSPTTKAKFVRRNPRRPNAKMAIYYDDRSGLIARGIIKPKYSRPKIPAPKPVPFPLSHDPEFAPPPPRHHWE